MTAQNDRFEEVAWNMIFRDAKLDLEQHPDEVIAVIAQALREAYEAGRVEEREACAKVAASYYPMSEGPTIHHPRLKKEAALMIAADIRSRK